MLLVRTVAGDRQNVPPFGSTEVMYPMSGFDLVRAIREVRPDVPVVITSGYFRQDDVVEAGALGLRSLVVKPDTVEELGRALHVEIGAS